MSNGNFSHIIKSEFYRHQDWGSSPAPPLYPTKATDLVLGVDSTLNPTNKFFRKKHSDFFFLSLEITNLEMCVLSGKTWEKMGSQLKLNSDLL